MSANLGRQIQQLADWLLLSLNSPFLLTLFRKNTDKIN